MRLELGALVRCSDGEQAGRLGDIVVDPVRHRVTHVVVHAAHGSAPARLVPFGLVADESAGGEVAMRCTSEELERLEPTQDFAVLGAGEHPAGGDGWDVGVEDDVPLAPYEATETPDYFGAFESTMIGVAFDRIPKGAVELRSSSSVECADGRSAGHLGGVELDGDVITHLTVPRGRLWWRHDLVVPIEKVAELATDAVVVTVASKEMTASR